MPGWESCARRGMDVIGASVLLLVLAPVLLGVAAWIRWDDGGPSLLRQERVGLNGRRFTLYKFRSMHVSVDDQAHRSLIAAELRGENTLRGGSTKIYSDPRVTRPGRFLRRTSLDELPQLLNVLRNEMSLVGPRPCLVWEAEMFPSEFSERFSVRPGLTGLWQVRGRSTVGTLEMLRMDLEYVRTRNIWLDLAILARTTVALIRPDGAR